MSEDKIWTVPEMAQHPNGRTGGYIRRLLIEGRMKGRKVGRDWQIPDSEARKWLDYWKQGKGE
jgi:hypothetical protein